MKRIIIALFSILTVVSCDTTVSTNSGQRILPNVTGAAGEVLVVMDEFLWNGDAGEALKDVLQEEFPGLPQSEPMFSTPQMTSGSFDNANRYHRSIALVTIKETAEEASVKFRKDVWAKPQIVAQIEAPNKAALIDLLKRKKGSIQSFFVQYDRQRVADNYKETTDPALQKMIAENHQIILDIPRGYNVDVSGADYSSISIEAADFSQVLHVYEYPAEGEKDMTSERLIAQRNKITGHYVKGPHEGSYMTTSKVYPPMFYDVAKDGKDIVEIRGLWDLENGFMGGPFVSHSIFDEKRNRIVTVEGYVFYPNQKKRVKVRQLEAIIYSMKLI